MGGRSITRVSSGSGWRGVASTAGSDIGRGSSGPVSGAAMCCEANARRSPVTRCARRRSSRWRRSATAPWKLARGRSTGASGWAPSAGASKAGMRVLGASTCSAPINSSIDVPDGRMRSCISAYVAGVSATGMRSKDPARVNGTGGSCSAGRPGASWRSLDWGWKVMWGLGDDWGIVRENCVMSNMHRIRGSGKGASGRVCGNPLGCACAAA